MPALLATHPIAFPPEARATTEVTPARTEQTVTAATPWRREISPAQAAQ